ncbi:expressed hypothetical protein [Trichoplax adhaerens]|uniref:ETS domain-containing protein n=1 Tax=Trichoplax adhaerens TaxID=10228 RepID=B3S711_TRIAD|nr:expressed hypothetical protein [Trichoplax adhaerens]EDV21405.1 expressed hypothetical protein [Trichoplax adhaerens]|eukprot:XP_002116005.1 expressed hypothetical protein [Trichoplax adhaerens]
MAIYSPPVINDIHLHQYDENSSENSSNVWNYSDQDSDSDHGYDSYNNLNDTVTGQNRRYPDNGFQFHMDTMENTSFTTSDSFFNPLPPNDFSEYDPSSEGPSSPDSIYGGNNEIKKPIKDNRRRKKFKGEASQPLTLWEYILMNLIAPESKEFVKWSNEANGEFIIKDSKLLAESWGIHKCKQPTTYENLSRSLRYYYGEKILEKVQHRRLMYRFIKREQFNNSKQRYLNLKRKRPILSKTF